MRRGKCIYVVYMYGDGRLLSQSDKSRFLMMRKDERKSTLEAFLVQKDQTRCLDMITCI